MPLTRQKNERGVALIAVLCVLLTVGMLAASSVALSKASAEGLALCSGRVESWYAAESCASRIQWTLMREFEVNGDRELGKKLGGETKLLPGERLYADNVPHKLELYGAQSEYRIRDMLCGLDAIAAPASIRMLFREFGPSQAPQTQALAETLALRIEDYTDTDDFVRQDGFERSDYEAAGLAGLPRNGPIRFREELALIPGFASLFPEPEDGTLSIFRPIAPLGLPQALGRPSFMCASPMLIEKLCHLNAKELDAALLARERWQSQGIPLSDSLEPALQQKLKSSFSFVESAFCTFEIKGQCAGSPPGTLLLSMRADRQISGNFLTYYEWLQY